MQISNNIFNIIEGDSREKLKNLNSNSVQCIITSPPYWGLRDYNNAKQIGLEPILDDYLTQLENVFNELYRVLKPNGVFFLVIGDGYTSGNRKYRAVDKKNPARFLKERPDTPNGLKKKDLLGIPWKLAFILQKNGWYLRNDIIWHKPNAMPESVKDRPFRSHEYIFMFSKSERYYFDLSKLRGTDNKLLRSVWSINTSSKSTIHSATFPIELVKHCILSSTKPNDLILDPFCGIGTVGRACIETDRCFIGIEINNLYAKNAIQNLNKTVLNG